MEELSLQIDDTVWGAVNIFRDVELVPYKSHPNVWHC